MGTAEQADAGCVVTARLNGTLTITGKGKEFVDIILAGFIANLEWRKHNNKIWQIIIWTAA